MLRCVISHVAHLASFNTCVLSSVIYVFSFSFDAAAHSHINLMRTEQSKLWDTINPLKR